ncbi:hypothetical protein GRF29_8g3289713 [Pseudopithomyces chartarum]|uniref:Survival Motor Neuron Gemin2-binding domain-containing protein n=1 Tax=Pseudopithomyces chartarum TaxID=1892770 RepID=A0AAN6RMD5_9PLEO|nr:hypothetical protein GRF29_8g3289713 [Pseudopithomyces chartarum]
MPGISLDDRGAWDDSALINSWDEAVAEYQKYHSIAKSGKRLEDALTEAELDQLRGDYGDLMDQETGSFADPNQVPEAAEAAQPQAQTNGLASGGSIAAQEVRATSTNQGSAHPTETAAPQEGPKPASMPEALLGSVQDENMKNLMMSWYYAGYYTGLVAGQQQGAPEAELQHKQQ